jgi:hypothetical protein
MGFLFCVAVIAMAAVGGTAGAAVLTKSLKDACVMRLEGEIADGDL